MEHLHCKAAFPPKSATMCTRSDLSAAGASEWLDQSDIESGHRLRPVPKQIEAQTCTTFSSAMPAPIAPESALEPGMYMRIVFMYMHDRLMQTGGDSMPAATRRTHKHFQLDASKIKRAQRALHARTETEAIERALDFAIAEHEKNRLVLAATERFVKSGIDIKDVYRTLGG